jgi:ferredoxin-NADP reductase
LTKKEELEGTDIRTFKFAKNEYHEYKAGQFAFFPLDTVNNDSRDPVRHFSLASLLSDINNCNNFLVLA